MPQQPTDILLVATDDAPHFGVRAGDYFLWEYTAEGPRLRQIRDWKNPITLLRLFDLGVLSPVEESPSPPQAFRQAVGSSVEGPSQPLRLVD